MLIFTAHFFHHSFTPIEAFFFIGQKEKKNINDRDNENNNIQHINALL